MHVIAALDEERQAKPERADELVRPGAERDYRVAGREPAGVARNHPAGGRRLEAAGVALLHPAAALDEQRGIGARQPLRVRRRQGLDEMSAADRRLPDMR